jgi:transposase-like protein
MPFSEIVAPKPSPIERPACPKCGAFMWLVTIMPHEPGWEQPFECADCGHKVIRIFRWRALG